MDRNTERGYLGEIEKVYIFDKNLGKYSSTVEDIVYDNFDSKERIKHFESLSDIEKATQERMKSIGKVEEDTMQNKCDFEAACYRLDINETVIRAMFNIMVEYNTGSKTIKRIIFTNFKEEDKHTIQNMFDKILDEPKNTSIVKAYFKLPNDDYISTIAININRGRVTFDNQEKDVEKIKYNSVNGYIMEDDNMGQVIESDLGVQEDVINFAKVRPSAIIPSKNVEDGGYDVYASFVENYMIIHPHQTKMIPTGIASAFSDEYVFVGRERGSTGSKGMALRSAVIDSGYRGEWFIPITNVNNYPIIIIRREYKEHYSDYKTLVPLLVKDAKQNNIDIFYLNKDLIKKTIFYPYEKGICQVLYVPVPKARIEEIGFEDLQKIPSKRGSRALGSSGK